MEHLTPWPHTLVCRPAGQTCETWLNWDLRQKAKQRAGLKIENFDLFWTYSINRHYEFSSRNIFPHPKNWKQTINKTAAFVFALLLGSSTQLCEDSVCLVPTPFYVFAHHIINSSTQPWLALGWHGFEVRFSLHLLMETVSSKQTKTIETACSVFVCAHPLRVLSNSD